MSLRFNVVYSVVIVVLSYVAFFYVSQIPMTEYLGLLLCTIMVRAGLQISLPHRSYLPVVADFVATTGATLIGYSLWGWALFWGGLAMAVIGLTGSVVWGLLYWLSDRRVLF